LHQKLVKSSSKKKKILTVSAKSIITLRFFFFWNVTPHTKLDINFVKWFQLQQLLFLCSICNRWNLYFCIRSWQGRSSEVSKLLVTGRTFDKGIPKLWRMLEVVVKKRKTLSRQYIFVFFLWARIDRYSHILILKMNRTSPYNLCRKQVSLRYT